MSQCSFPVKGGSLIYFEALEHGLLHIGPDWYSFSGSCQWLLVSASMTWGVSWPLWPWSSGRDDRMEWDCLFWNSSQELSVELEPLLWKASLTFSTTVGLVIWWLSVVLVCQESCISWIISFIMSRVMLVISCLVAARSSWNSSLSSVLAVAPSSTTGSGSCSSEGPAGSSAILGPMVGVLAGYLGLFMSRCLMLSSCVSSMLANSCFLRR